MGVDVEPRTEPVTTGGRILAGVWAEDAGALDRLREEWNPLLLRSKANRVFLTWEWVSIWWKHFGTGRDLRVLLLRDGDGALRGIAPLYLDVTSTPLGTVRKIQFLGYGGDANPDFLNFVFEAGWEAECMEATWDALVARRAEWDLLKLTDLCEEAPEATLLPVAAAKRGLRVHRFLDTVCPYLPLAGSFEDVLSGLRSNLRRDIRRGIRKVLGEMKGQILPYNEPGRTDEGLEALARLHQMRMEESDRGGNFRRRTYLEFHREIMARFAQRGWLELRILRVDGIDVAANYGFRYDGVLYGYQMGLHPGYYKHSLGTVLLGKLIEELTAEGFREVDMLRGRSHWKYRWTGLERKNWSFVVEAAGLRGRKAFWGDLSANRPGVILKRILPERAFAGLQHALRAVKARVKGDKSP